MKASPPCLDWRTECVTHSHHHNLVAGERARKTKRFAHGRGLGGGNQKTASGRLHCTVAKTSLYLCWVLCRNMAFLLTTAVSLFSIKFIQNHPPLIHSNASFLVFLIFGSQRARYAGEKEANCTGVVLLDQGYLSGVGCCWLTGAQWSVELSIKHLLVACEPSISSHIKSTTCHSVFIASCILTRKSFTRDTCPRIEAAKLHDMCPSWGASRWLCDV